jgi:hypothetical protein
MLLWILAIGGLTLAVATVALLFVAMHHAERRARRRLFRALSLDDETVELLMARNGDVLAELTLVRRHMPSTEPGDAGGQAETLARRAQPAIRFHSLEGGGANSSASPTAVEPRPPAADRRRLPRPGRQGRP